MKLIEHEHEHAVDDLSAAAASAGVPPRARPKRLRAAALLLAPLSVVVLSVAGVVWFQFLRRTDPPRLATAIPPFSAQQEADFRSFRDSAPEGPAQPFVLSYHDISSGGDRGPYIVSPEHFARDMAMLSAAGFVTITLEQFHAYQRGDGVLPQRSVLITFDDGTSGLYTYADRILARFGFSAVSFVISGRVGTHLPYYLTWRQIEIMQRSGRWEFAAHTHNLHQRFRWTNGVLRSELTSRHVVDGRVEPLADLEARIHADMEQFFADFQRHHLPRPAYFAWPFSEVADPAPDGEAAQLAMRLVSENFAHSFLNRKFSRSVDRRMIDDSTISRLEIFESTTTDDLFRQAREAQAIALTGELHPARSTRWWIEPTFAVAPIDVDPHGDTITVDARTETEVVADFAPQATGDWANYRVAANLTPDPGAGVTGTEQQAVGVVVRSGSVAELSVIVEAGRVALRFPRAARPQQTVGIPPAPTHRVEIEVRAERSVVAVDGRVVATVDVNGEGRGGVGVYLRRADDQARWPTIGDMTVAPVS